jgi:hypothetical protein
MAIEVGPGIDIGPGVLLGDEPARSLQIITENGLDIQTESGDNLITE